MSREAHIDALWAEAAPPTVTKTLNSYLAHLRHQLREAGLAGLIATRGPGYVLLSPRDAVDAARFELFAGRGRDALAAGDARTATESLRAGLVLWRGDALSDCRPGQSRRAESTRLGEARLAATEDLIAARMDLGGHTAAIGELEFLIVAHPFRERLWELLILALYRSGRQADAVAAFQRARNILITELGIEPGRQLRRLETAVLTADPVLDLPEETRTRGDYVGVSGAAQPAVVPAQLPSTVAGFTGRAEQLRQLDTVLSEAWTAPVAVVISAIAGTAGIGKTTLAVHWAHRVADRFPDGQLHVNLRGFDPRAPMEAGQALHGFLHALGVDPQAIPAAEDAKAALYRSLLAGRRMLVVLDNARDTDHVRLLLPASPGCVVVITSRNRLDSLAVRDGAHRLILDLLSADEAVALLTQRLGSKRVQAEPDAVTELIELCARLPLAVSIVAARAASCPHLPLRWLVEELCDERARLDMLELGDVDLDLRVVFSWSYRTLTGQAAGLFRLLGIHPGPDIGLPAAATLAGIRIPEARTVLTKLTRAHLLGEHAPGRYRFHDLLRAYAGEKAAKEDPEPQQRTAIHRVLDFYLHTSFAADRYLDPRRHPITLNALPAGITPVQITNYEQAMGWFTSEHATLLAAIHHAATHAFDIHAWQLPWTLTTYLDRQGHWHDHTATQQTALAAARRLSDRNGQAHTLRTLGRTYTHLGRCAEALTHTQQALALFEELGDRTGQAHSHRTLGFIYGRQNRDTEGLTHATRALDLYRATSNQAGEAVALNNIGWHHAQLGRYQQALTHCHHALDLLRKLGDRLGEADTLDSLGYIHFHLGHHTQAITHYQHAVALYRNLDDHYFEATTLIRLGDTHHTTGDHPPPTKPGSTP